MNVMGHTKSRGPKRPPAARAGRPPAGIGGEKVSDYTQVTLRLPPATKALLEAISGMTGMATSRVIEQALGAFVRELPADEQKVLTAIQQRRARAE